MKQLTVKHKKLDREQITGYKNSKPQTEHVSTIIDDESMLYLGDKLIAVYKSVPFDTGELLKACHQLKFEPYKRTSGIITQTININAVPRNGLRDNICKLSRLAQRDIRKHDTFLEYGKKISTSYRRYFSSAYSSQVKETYVGNQKTESYYLIKGTPFTSAVANKDCALNYHYDNANTKDGISCMIILKGNVAGGELILPELDIGFSCQDDFILLFDGQKYLHGVTEIIKSNGGYRYTIVYYNNKGMHLCLPPNEEIIHHQQWLERK